MENLIQRASVLIEALPYIRRFHGKTIVVKYGGSGMVSEELKESFARDITLLKYIGMNPVIVHGGGPQIGSMLKKLGIESRFHDGIRITDAETMDIVEMVLGGKINKEIVALINRHGGKAVGLSGKDGQLVMADKVPAEEVKKENSPPELIDLGRVGKVKKINPAVLETLDSENFIPVIAPVGVSDEGETLNINADWVAGEIAGALKAEKIILLTDISGVQDENEKLVPALKKARLEEMLAKHVIQGGMRPKVKAALRALEKGVHSAHIIDGRVQHAVLLEILTDKGVGTIVS
jgi:acetylglutamate kinase